MVISGAAGVEEHALETKQESLAEVEGRRVFRMGRLPPGVLVTSEFCCTCNKILAPEMSNAKSPLRG